ncbi:MAG: sulfatase, partial [Halorientalis sp.]
AYRTADWKYIRDYVHDDEELYDLRADPGEQSNLLDGDEREPDVLDELRRVVDEYEDDIEATDTEVESVEMDDDVKERLRNLGYQE